MSLGRSKIGSMDLAAFRVVEVAEIRPGVFCHPATIAGRIARLLGHQPVPPSEPTIPTHLAARRRAAAKTEDESK